MAIGYRMNIDCLTDDQLHELREALAALYLLPASNPNSFALLATFHGGPPITYCRHGSPGFFTWHRAEMKAFEDALMAVGCGVRLPYWDWSSGPSTGIPEACRDATYVNRSGATVANPLYAGPRHGGGMTNRSPSIGSTAFDDLAAQVQAAMSETSFASFQNLVNGPHGSVHGRVGGDMCCVPSASYDPIFYLHHANVDRIWARWQVLHPGPLPPNEASWELPPFNRPFSNQWQTGADVVSTDALGYRYRTFCFWLPPIRLWEVALLRWPPDVRERFTTARLVFKSDRMQQETMEIRAFVNQPRATARTKTIGNPAYAGTLGFLGHGDAMHAIDPAHCPECAALGHTLDHDQHEGHIDVHPAQADERFDVELELGAALRKADVQDDELALKLVVVDGDGAEVDADRVAFDEIELVVE